MAINCSDEQKEEFDKRFPESSHKEGFQELLDAHSVLDEMEVDIDALSNQIAQDVHTRLEEQTLPMMEIVAKRAVDEALTND